MAHPVWPQFGLPEVLNTDREPHSLNSHVVLPAPCSLLFSIFSFGAFLSSFQVMLEKMNAAKYIGFRLVSLGLGRNHFLKWDNDPGASRQI